MQELIEWLQDNWGERLKTSSIIILVLILLDKIGFTWLDHQGQKRLESKIDALMKGAGVEWHATTLAEELQDLARRHEKFWRWHFLKCIIARSVAKYIRFRLRRKRQMNLERISKANLLALFSAVALFIKQAFGYEVASDQIDMAVNGALIIISIIGILRNRKQPKKDAFLQDDTGE